MDVPGFEPMALCMLLFGPSPEHGLVLILILFCDTGD